MKKTIKSYSSKVLAVVAVVAVLLSCMVFSVSAAQLSSVAATEQISTPYGAVDYAKYEGSNADSYVMEFNPKASNLVPMAYIKNAGTSSTMSANVTAAKDAGYDVYGAINGEFFSMGSGNFGTLTGRLIGNGRILSDHETNNEYSFVIDKDGNFEFVRSELSYHFYIEGKEVGSSVIARINKRYNGDWGYDPYCYFDSACGSKTDTVSGYKGVEVVFNKLNGTELMPESVLEGEVVSVNTNTYGTKFEENQFVLYAYNNSAYANYLKNLTPGQKVQIYAEELNEDAKEIMKKANSVMAATYPIVDGGVNVANKGPMTSVGELDVNSTRAQRTAIGVKADGTYVYFVSSGRNYHSGDGAGMTIKEVGDALIELGCVRGVALDGGGSSTLNYDGVNKYVTENRAVGSVMMIVGRNAATTTPAEKQELNNWIYNASSELAAGTYTGEQKALVETEIQKANAVYNNVNSMNGEYIRAVMELRTAMGVVPNVLPKTYISLDANDWSMDISAMNAENLANGGLRLNSVKAGWPWGTYACKVAAAPDDVLIYNISATANTSIILYSGSTQYNINAKVAPNSLDGGSGDIAANGQSFKGMIKISDLNASGIEITSVQICSSAGSASSVTLNEFTIRSKYSTGDVDGDYMINSNDGRSLLRHISGASTVSGSALAAADANGDGQVNTEDIRYILNKSVGLA